MLHVYFVNLNVVVQLIFEISPFFVFEVSKIHSIFQFVYPNFIIFFKYEKCSVIKSLCKKLVEASYFQAIDKCGLVKIYYQLI